jgi:hypothetical protein
MRRRLNSSNAAASIQDLRVPPSQRLHPLKGDRRGQWSISVNDQFRICFVWGVDGPEDVAFVDYHWYPVTVILTGSKWTAGPPDGPLPSVRMNQSSRKAA